MVTYNFIKIDIKFDTEKINYSNSKSGSPLPSYVPHGGSVLHTKSHTPNFSLNTRPKKIRRKNNSAFPWISAQTLLEPLLDMHTTFYMSGITYLDMLPWSYMYLILRAIPAIHETNALREVLWQRNRKLLYLNTITFLRNVCCNSSTLYHTCLMQKVSKVDI